MAKHLMLDLETLGTCPGSVVTQVALLEFDPFSPLEFGRSMQIWLNITDQKGLVIDSSTLHWWTQQNPAAIRRLIRPDKEGLTALQMYDVMHEFYRDLPEGAMTPIWAHGGAFDTPLLEVVYRNKGFSPPWHYRAIRDTRTLYTLTGGVPDALVQGVPHDALDDCKAQATQVQQAFLQLRNLFPDLADGSGATPVRGTPLGAFAEAVGAPVLT